MALHTDPTRQARFMVHRDYRRLDELAGMTPTILHALHDARLHWAWEVALLCPRCLLKVQGIGTKSVAILLTAIEGLEFPPVAPCERGREHCLSALRHITWDVQEQTRDVNDWLQLMRAQMKQMQELAHLCQRINTSLAATLESFETSSGAREVLQMVTNFMVRHSRNGALPEEVPHG